MQLFGVSASPHITTPGNQAYQVRSTSTPAGEQDRAPGEVETAYRVLTEGHGEKGANTASVSPSPGPGLPNTLHVSPQEQPGGWR